LGNARRADTVEVRWPSGQRQVFHDVNADNFYLIAEDRDQISLQRIVRKERVLVPVEMHSAKPAKEISLP